jgi:hypothetical protein
MSPFQKTLIKNLGFSDPLHIITIDGGELISVLKQITFIEFDIGFSVPSLQAYKERKQRNNKCYSITNSQT